MKTLLTILGFQAVNNATKYGLWIFLLMIGLLAIVVAAAILINYDKGVVSKKEEP